MTSEEASALEKRLKRVLDCLDTCLDAATERAQKAEAQLAAWKQWAVEECGHSTVSAKPALATAADYVAGLKELAEKALTERDELKYRLQTWNDVHGEALTIETENLARTPKGLRKLTTNEISELVYSLAGVKALRCGGCDTTMQLSEFRGQCPHCGNGTVEEVSQS